jgi:hypothetical protein
VTVINTDVNASQLNYTGSSYVLSDWKVSTDEFLVDNVVVVGL